MLGISRRKVSMMASLFVRNDLPTTRVLVKTAVIALNLRFDVVCLAVLPTNISILCLQLSNSELTYPNLDENKKLTKNYD